ncbi:MAG: DUF1365 domain-containing protein [Legionellales bacterium]|nr:DUF1365 domain-containing protein [Legionellales bacterium]
MDSCIYEGIVTHTRFFPRKHFFKYRLFMMFVNINNLEEKIDKYLFWSSNKFNLAYFKRSDHMGDATEALAISVKKFIQDGAKQKFDGDIYLLTHFRYFGYCFNPVSFYFCTENNLIKFVIMEVNNTPWGEQHCYLLEIPMGENLNGYKFRFNKKMHVSPFMEMKMDYVLSCKKYQDMLNITINNIENNKTIFIAKMGLKKKAINRKNMFLILMKYPIMTYKVIFGIHYQALKLWFKRVKVVYHPKFKDKS